MPDSDLFSPHPDDVVYQLRGAGWDYRNTPARTQDVGFADIRAFPFLFKFVKERQQVPPMAICKEALLAHRDEPPDGLGREERQEWIGWADARAQKLVMDFYRELHTFTLLQPLGSVSYRGILDIDLGVDFLISLTQEIQAQRPNRESLVGVQAAMRHPKWWNEQGEDYFTALKRARLRRRGGHEWRGETYWLTNRVRPYDQSVGGVWLFGPDHIEDLRIAIIGN